MPVAHIDSYYAASANPAPERPALTGDVEADVCVVGGGIAGCATALFLAERGYKVVAARGQSHRIRRVGSQRRPGDRRLRLQPGQAGRTGGQGRRAEDVRHLGRRARPVEEPGRETPHRLRPALGSPAHRAQAAAGGRPAGAPGRTERLRLLRHSLARPCGTRPGARHRSLHRRRCATTAAGTCIR